MNPIGGYFGLELPPCGNTPQPLSVRVNSGRNAMEYLLRARLPEGIRSVALPDFTCPVLLPVVSRLGLTLEFYPVGLNLEATRLPEPRHDRIVVINNYFGIKDAYVERIAPLYGDNAVTDASQALFAPPVGAAFYSPRKFVGLPDGGLAHTAGNCTSCPELTEQDTSHARASHLLIRADCGPSEGYADFKANSAALASRPLMRMSALTAAMMDAIDFQRVKEARAANYERLRSRLQHLNILPTPRADRVACPMVYPFLTCSPGLRAALIERRVFVARYWPGIEAWCSPGAEALTLMDNLLPLPIDQRYGPEEMDYITDIILSYGK